MQIAMNRPVRELRAIVIAGTAAVVVFLACQFLYGLLFDAWQSPLIPTVITIIALVAGFMFSWRLARRWLALAPLSLSSPLSIAILGSLYLTWAFGAPQVHTDLAAAEIARYKELRELRSKYVGEVHPRI